MNHGVADLAILETIAESPLTTREISDRIRRRVCEQWSAQHGYDFEWFTDDEPLGARLLATSDARERGYLLQPWEIDRRLRILERNGDAERLQLEGRRPMLWRATLQEHRCRLDEPHEPHVVRLPAAPDTVRFCPGEP